ncbi:MAG: hypothetical protein ABI689_18340, partial [Thermoanaerobaculia bacterium]
EIRSHGIIVDGASTRAYKFTFGFGIEGHTFDYNAPIVYWYPNLRRCQPDSQAGGWSSGLPRGSTEDREALAGRGER